jgi:hypothetical protein
MLRTITAKYAYIKKKENDIAQKKNITFDVVVYL